jgi:hypothetical protein
LVECLDFVSGEWSNLAPLKTARHEHALVVVDGKWLWAIGGIDNSGKALNSMERYDIERNQWIQVTKPTKVRRGGVAAAIYGIKYIANVC